MIGWFLNSVTLKQPQHTHCPYNKFVLNLFSISCFFVAMKKILSFIFLCGVMAVSAQSIGAFKDHLPYKNAIALCGYNQQLMVATENALFIANKSDNKAQRLSKVQGLSDVGVSCMNSNESRAVVGYSNGNIDVLEGLLIHNIPNLKNENMLGEKRVNSVYYHQ